MSARLNGDDKQLCICAYSDVRVHATNQELGECLVVGVVTVKHVALKLSLASKSIMIIITSIMIIITLIIIMMIIITLIIIIIIIIMYIYHALIDAQSAHMIHFKLNAVLCTHVVQSPTQVT